MPDETGDWHPARLIPTAGIRGQEEQERRATSSLLAVMYAVPEFGRAVLSELGAPRGMEVVAVGEVVERQVGRGVLAADREAFEASVAGRLGGGYVPATCADGGLSADGGSTSARRGESRSRCRCRCRWLR